MRSDSELVEYIKANRRNTAVDMAKAVIVEFVPSMKQLFRVLREEKYFVDTQNQPLKDMLRKAYRLNSEGLDEDARFRYFEIEIFVSIEEEVERLSIIHTEVSKGSVILCLDNEYGVGEVVQIAKDGDIMFVKFASRPLKTACSKKKMTTIHDEVKRKLKHVLTA